MNCSTFSGVSFSCYFSMTKQYIHTYYISVHILTCMLHLILSTNAYLKYIYKCRPSQICSMIFFSFSHLHWGYGNQVKESIFFYQKQQSLSKSKKTQSKNNKGSQKKNVYQKTKSSIKKHLPKRAHTKKKEEKTQIQIWPSHSTIL